MQFLMLFFKILYRVGNFNLIFLKLNLGLKFFCHFLKISIDYWIANKVFQNLTLKMIARNSVMILLWID